MELNIELFNSTIAELTELAESYKGLNIAGPDDKEGYERVKKARIDLGDKRIAITNKGLEIREDANAYIKNVRKYELGLVAITEPVEDELQAKQDAIDEQIERNKRQALLPERREKCQSINCDPSDDLLLSLDPEAFAAFFNEQKEIYLNEKEAALKAEQERIDAEKRAEQEEIERQETARKQVEAAEALEATAKAQREADEARHTVELERAKTEAAALERERIEREAKEKAEREAKEQAELESKKKYQAFLKKHGVTAATIADKTYELRQEGNQVRIYKLVDTLTL